MFLLISNRDSENLTKIGQKHFVAYPSQKHYIFMLKYIICSILRTVLVSKNALYHIMYNAVPTCRESGERKFPVGGK